MAASPHVETGTRTMVYRSSSIVLNEVVKAGYDGTADLIIVSQTLVIPFLPYDLST
ncbi:hypothetical protein PZA11_003176 [Diplocarpon coronariae]